VKHEIHQKPDYAIVRLELERPGEQVLVEPSAMVAMDTAVAMKTGVPGGMFRAAKRKLFGGESFFRNTFTATEAGQTLWIAPAPEGDVEAVQCAEGTPVLLSSGAFLASAPTVALDTKWNGARGFFGGAGLFLLRATGEGVLFFGCYGGIHAVDVGPHGYIVDTNHVVAFTGGLDFRVTKVGGVKSLFFSGEGLVCEFRGEGRLWLSTRNPAGLASFLDPFRPVERG